MGLMKKRCQWVSLDNKLYLDYHDNKWGVPVHSDRILFEFLILEGAQAGLSWVTILKHRKGYKKAFANFDPQKVAKFNIRKEKQLLKNPDIIRNRLKIKSAINNAKSFLKIQKEFGSFDKYIWPFVDGKPIINKWKKVTQIPAKTKLAEALSLDLKKRGFNFVGPTIIYAYMQACGLVNDHTIDCFRYKQVNR